MIEKIEKYYDEEIKKMNEIRSPRSESEAIRWEITASVRALCRVLEEQDQRIKQLEMK